jgi:hypothetical protein
MLLAKLYNRDESEFRHRDPKYKATDQAALSAIAQAAIEVELFTIPLYMTSLYSIQGFHQINSSSNDFYAGRQWPGLATTAEPKTANEKAFNIVFSVFIQEMLHLQLASNMATTIGVTPVFTGPALQNQFHGWTCYGKDLTVIPHIIDLKDTRDFDQIKVNVGPLDKDTLDLFIAIEQPEKEAKEYLKPGVLESGKYFPKVPFEKWQPGEPLPLFGTIGYMYQCYGAYLQMRYSDGTTLWDAMFNKSPAQQNDLFNNYIAEGHPMREFPGFETTIAPVYSEIAQKQMLDMMDAIADQGEGGTLPFKQRHLLLSSLDLERVRWKYQSSYPALASDYPSYDQAGQLRPSADAKARGDADPKTHYERFLEIKHDLLKDVVTWSQWLKTHGQWTADDFIFKSDGPAPTPNPKLPGPDQTATAMNELTKQPNAHTLLSQVAIGAIAGVTTVLDEYWSAKVQAKGAVAFPMPSMTGSGDRMAIVWAVTGQTPDLMAHLDPPTPNELYHACQGLSWEYDGKTVNDCAAVPIFHSCKGSNSCHAQGGCGFAQSINGGGSCGGSSCAPSALTSTVGGMRRISEPKIQAMCSKPTAGPGYQPVSDNKCKAFGGCAVPISAYQIYPESGTMALYWFKKDSSGQDGYTSEQIMFGPNAAELPFAKGDRVHDIAYKAYQMAMKSQNPGVTVPDKPPSDNTLRLVFPPST